MAISKKPFDGAAAWSGLSPELQAQVGALALEAAAGAWMADTCHGDEPVVRAAAWAYTTAVDGIESLFVMGPDLDPRRRRCLDAAVRHRTGLPRVRLQPLRPV